ncbi:MULTISPECIES: nucleotidyltransferase domain-containing protein [unclassified Oleiphilus]|jgi:predicted nucleotidyltransferase|uniref:nucleotidyltransferase domain-containing protein n=2 Tax=Oleiphilus TaxID=141450 RepID=UPI0007C32AB9|nr:MULTISPECIES: nucleotidyltransferase domain-containing protein [unclassified Oleiphilus]KZY80465.1 hypothetical protein A3741_05520 [Oleiphilus sp. HI0069]KZY81560.1 hypothetical protein A3740_06070 [Oleiphilus sp. HI0068]KZY97404.1 hypothetical protein A3743_03890 [Oleiphilus sp. HI0072]KZZ07568.1 hypothetical protein A3749_15355 [Oleiphilus sp. HI0078]KZZ25545.1 hypothetical protein A3752_00480 [Oleiphilus sp. HI0081]KZZ34204.1 hypothetical protein A3755_06390 [Oleiphilus sp. HI0085]
MSQFGLSEQTLSEIRDILSKYEMIDYAKLYGSRAKGNYHERSDIDIAVVGDNIDRFTSSALALDFADSDIPLVVDVHCFHDIKNLQLRDHIERVGQVIYESKGA